MCIKVHNARKNNLNNISIDIPLNKIIAITGVSGSGKTTLARDIIAQYSYKEFLINKNKSLRNELIDDNVTDVASINNNPPAIWIEVKNSINNRNSTLGTISGILKNLRNIFVEYADLYCCNCGNKLNDDIFTVIENYDFNLLIEMEMADNIDECFNSINEIIKIKELKYFNKDKKETKNKKTARYITILLDKPSKNIKNIIKNIYNKLNLEVLIDIPKLYSAINPKTHTICSSCNSIIERKLHKRFSFNIDFNNGGGACRKCSGSGEEITIDYLKLLNDENKSIISGAIKFVSDKGVQYSNTTVQDIEIFAKHYGFTSKTKYSNLDDNQKHLLFYGGNDIIKYKVRGIEYVLNFNGIVNSLIEGYLKGKGLKYIEPLIEKKICSSCNGTRIDNIVFNIKLFDYSIGDLLKLSINQLYNVISNMIELSNDNSFTTELKILKNNLNIYNMMSCGYLNLNRLSKTLSGGEVQRIRLCSYISLSISNSMIILDEPTSGLHSSDIKDLINLFNKIKEKGNTIIIIEHNKDILTFCDYIIDIGEGAGKYGGNLLFQDYIYNIDKYKTPTALYLKENSSIIDNDKNKYNILSDKMLKISNCNSNNLKNFNVDIPLYSLTAVCGVSGSGKSSFIKNHLIPFCENNNINKKNTSIFYLSQSLYARSSNSNVCSILELTELISNLFGLSKTDSVIFSLNSNKGKCTLCNGNGIIKSVYNEYLGMCPKCLGKRFDDETLKYKYKGYNIDDLLNFSIIELYDILSDNKTFNNIFKKCIEIGIGHLTLNRSASSLSKGEYQRLKLVHIFSNELKNNIIVLDEPTSGLHNKDIRVLLEMLRDIQKNNNTIISVEHNLDFILQTDYIIEIGPKAGDDGGYLLYCGKLDDFLNCDTPTTIAVKNKSKIKNENKKIDNIKQVNNQKIIFETKINEFDINKINNTNLFEKLAKYSNTEYISSIFPNYEHNDEIYENETYLPIINIIDFNNIKNRYLKSSSIIDLLNIKDMISLAFSENRDNRNLLLNVFDVDSKVGKCKLCYGSGSVDEIDLNLIFDKNILNKSILKFLKEISNYSEAVKQLKKIYNNEIDKDFDKMSDEDKYLLLYGDFSKVFKIDGKNVYWQGIIPLLITQGKYFPDENLINNIKSSRKNVECTLCEGKLIDKDYLDYKLLDKISFSDFINLNFEELSKLIKNKKVTNIYLDNIISVIDVMLEFGFNEYSFNTNVSSIKDIDKTLLLFISYLRNNLYGTYLYIKNIDSVNDKKIRSLLDKYVKILSETNTILID